MLHLSDARVLDSLRRNPRPAQQIRKTPGLLEVDLNLLQTGPLRRHPEGLSLTGQRATWVHPRNHPVMKEIGGLLLVSRSQTPGAAYHVSLTESVLWVPCADTFLKPTTLLLQPHNSLERSWNSCPDLAMLRYPQVHFLHLKWAQLHLHQVLLEPTHSVAQG